MSIKSSRAAVVNQKGLYFRSLSKNIIKSHFWIIVYEQLRSFKASESFLAGLQEAILKRNCHFLAGSFSI